EFNYTSSNNYDTALQLAASIATGLAEVQSGKGFSPASGTFSTQGLNMEWTGPIQAITEEKKRKADYLIKDGEMCGRLEETSAIKKAWGDKVDSVVKMFETVKKIWNGTVIGTGKAVEDTIKSMETLSNMNIRNMDIETFINVTYAILHLDETAKNMWHTFSSTVKRDMINGDAESRTQWITYALTQIGIGLITDKGVGRAGLVIKGVKASSGASTLTKGVTLIKEMRHASEILQSFKKDVSYAFSGGTIITKIPQSELNQAYYNFAKTTISSAQKRNSPGTVTSSFNLERSLGTQKKLMYNKGSIGVIPQEIRNKLIGKNFNSFDDFRKEFWKTVADSDYATEFNQRNINLMKEGKAPFAPLSEKYGQHNQYILHHKQPIHQGGDVYNLDNLIIVSPKMHQNVLDRSYHFGKKG
ncbi:colicin, partial [Bacillus wiedmannii]